jgi:peptidoglycan/xylan/chitin deacetylase (PgdA/CDA1 family)/folate-dependent phosphoribosylglycinamide formyltransferase PurN
MIDRINLKRIVIFTGSLDFNLRWNAVSLADKFPGVRFIIFLHAPRRNASSVIYSQLRNIGRHGWQWIPYQLTEACSRVSAKYRPHVIRSLHRPGQMYSISALETHPRIEIRKFDDVNGNKSKEALAELSVDLGIALGAPILRKEIFSIPRLATINLHKGRLPDYRGMPPAFWEMKNGEKKIGCTVHKIDERLDAGDILLETCVPVDDFSTVFGMQLKLHRIGVNLVCEAVRLLSEGNPDFKKRAPAGKPNTRPALAVERDLNRKLKGKELAPNRTKTFFKKILFIAYSYVMTPPINHLRALLGRQRVIILLYHRVSDQFRDNVTIGIEQFDQQIRHLAANYNVVSLKEIVEGQIPRNSSRPIIAVSFDDGYLDNFENAAPILLKHQVPCTFFISTDKVKKNAPFEHDLKALGYGLKNMSWDNITQMRDWGFHFGSHTLNHVNLAAVQHAEALHELKESLNEIRSRLNQNNVYLAYPYGRKHNITLERIQMVKELGYAACFSAYGGYNGIEMDLFDIKRIGINWAFDMASFEARLRGWDTTR